VKDQRSIEARVRELEARDEIRQLAAQYALAADMCDVDMLVGLYVDDIEIAPDQRGSEHLRRNFADAMTRFDATAHLIANHLIRFDGDERAEGIVYCAPQYAVASQWVIAQLIYHDWYERRQGRWLFRRPRVSGFWFVCDQRGPPLGVLKVRWPDSPASMGTMHTRTAPIAGLFDSTGTKLIDSVLRRGPYAS